MSKINFSRKKKKSKIKTSGIVIIAAVVFLVLLKFITDGIKVDVEINPNKYTVANPIIINIETKYNGRVKSLDSLNINITHKYNHDINQTVELVDYEKGQYTYIFNPPDPGEYTITIYGSYSGEEVSYDKDIVVD